MPAMLVFLLKVNIALLLFCAGYYFVLRHLTFYTLNRIYLIAAILFASVYPQINLDSFAQQHQQLTQPVQVILSNLETPAQTLIQPIAQPNYWYWVELVFWLGVALLALRLLMQLYSLYKLYRGSTPANIYGYQVRAMKGDSGPFSFWKNIYVNPDNHNPADLRSILLHEQVHVNQWHTLDILLAELSTVFYWFNPGIWLIKKAVRENIEFITDNKILNKGIDSKAYQYSLVNVSFASGPQSIVNHFNLSTIKKRIIMMNAKRSSKLNLTRYAFLMPVVIMLLLVFTISKAAFVAKSTNVLNKLAATISTVNIIHDDVQNAMTAQPATVTKAKRTRVHKADTGHMAKIITDTIAKKRIEKRIYIVDGKVVDNYDINELDANDIASIEVTKHANDGQGVINIITKNGAKAQIITDGKINGKKFKITSDNGDVLVTDTGKKAKWRIVDSVYVLKAPPVRVNDKKVVSVTTVGYLSSGQHGPGKLLYATAKNTHSLDHLSDKMFVIDGKIATEKQVKKLSLLSIEQIIVKADDETKSIYGEKAKNGVVFIVTKKAN